MKLKPNLLLAVLVVISLLILTSAFAQTSQRSYAIELVVVRNKRSIETDADIIFGERTVKVVPDKTSLAAETKEFAYSDIKLADQSYSKKPLFSVGGGVTTVVLTSLIFPFIAVPFLFIKKKKHWMTIQTEKDYMVLKLGDRNFRQIASELETKGVKVSELKEKEK
ncbi:MAG: hypothetical protein JNL64_04955 [Blastocatellia bacterium]|nr:hypothetical protein [Blastocatellia bacterium]